MSSALTSVSRWYAAQCDGRWEHEFGVTIETIDNPGWRVVIDLTRTLLQSRVMQPVIAARGDRDWIRCEVVNAQFVGAGDPSKLEEILACFDAFLRSESGR